MPMGGAGALGIAVSRFLGFCGLAASSAAVFLWSGLTSSLLLGCGLALMMASLECGVLKGDGRDALRGRRRARGQAPGIGPGGGDGATGDGEGEVPWVSGVVCLVGVLMVAWGVSAGLLANLTFYLIRMAGVRGKGTGKGYMALALLGLMVVALSLSVMGMQFGRILISVAGFAIVCAGMESVTFEFE